MSAISLLPVKRQQQAADDAKDDNDKEAASAPGLGGTGVRFPSKYSGKRLKRDQVPLDLLTKRINYYTCRKKKAQ